MTSEPDDLVVPTTSWIYRAWVDIGPKIPLGASRAGERARVDILGGTFEGPLLQGRVLPGGQDRQLLTADRRKYLDAHYEMETDDGVVLTVRNRVTIDEAVIGLRYARSVISIDAPIGPYEWLSRRVIVGTLRSLRPERDVVCIDAFLLGGGTTCS